MVDIQLSKVSAPFSVQAVDVLRLRSHPENRMQRNGIGACMPISKVKVEVNESALLDVALKGMRERDFEIQCPSCGSAVPISSGEGECPCCGQLFKVGDVTS